MLSYQPITWHDNHLRLLDQRRLPQETTYIDYTDYAEVAHAIREMVVRGAPAIGITAAYGMALAARSSRGTSVETLRDDLREAAAVLADALEAALADLARRAA